MVLSEDIIEQIISFYFSDTPLNKCEIARRLAISRYVVHYWIKKFKSNPSGSPLRSRLGRPRQLSNPEEKCRESKRRYIQSKRKDPKFRAQEAEYAFKRRERKRACLDP